MTLGTWLAGLLLAFGPNGALVDARLDAAGPAYRDLVPVEWLGATPGSLWLVFHRRDDWVMAAYLPPDAEEMRWARAFPEVAASQFDRLLPALDVPRVFLRDSVYRRGGDLVDADSLAVDSSEILFNALLDAHLDFSIRRSEPWTRDLAERAEVVMAGVPEGHREEAFRNAVLDFGSHVLSLATEIARQSRRHPPAKLCALHDPPRALFLAWQRALDDGQFPGRWLRPADPSAGIAARRETVTTRETLRVEDKLWVAETILGADWTGDPGADFARFCRP